MSVTLTPADRLAARARAESIATRWVPAHMTARQGLVDDIAAAIENARQLGLERGEENRPAASDFDSTPPPEVLAAWAKDCKCCGECSPVICGGVSAGGFCDRICWCGRDDDDDGYPGSRDDDGDE